jgi:hypothetical protein
MDRVRTVSELFLNPQVAMDQHTTVRGMAMDQESPGGIIVELSPRLKE